MEHAPREHTARWGRLPCHGEAQRTKTEIAIVTSRGAVGLRASLIPQKANRIAEPKPPNGGVTEGNGSLGRNGARPEAGRDGYL